MPGKSPKSFLRIGVGDWARTVVLHIKSSVFFFFQAEDGIRDDLVTGVQTCALPILKLLGPSSFGIPSTKLQHHVRRKLGMFLGRDGATAPRLIENSSSNLLGTKVDRKSVV